MNLNLEGEPVLSGKISRILKSLYIINTAAYGIAVLSYAIYSLLTGRIGVSAVLFFLLLWYFMVFQTSFLGMRMPVSVGILFLLFGLAIFFFSSTVNLGHDRKVFFVATSVFFFLSATLLISSHAFEKTEKK